MNIRQVEIFRSIFKEGSVSRAAKALNISQPAASKYIAQLERNIRVSLFARVGGRLLPTPEGRALYEQTEKVFLGLSQLEEFMQDLSSEKTGHLTIASLPAVSLSVMPQVLARFLAQRPNTTAALQTRSSSTILDWVAARQIDCGICFCSSATVGVVAEPLASLQLYCALPPGDPLESKTEVTPEDLQGRAMITYDNLDHKTFWLEETLEKHRVSTVKRVKVFWASVAMDLVMEGVGIAFVDRLTASRVANGLQQLRPFRPIATFDLSLVWPEHWPASTLATSFANELRAYMKSVDDLHGM